MHRFASRQADSEAKAKNSVVPRWHGHQSITQCRTESMAEVTTTDDVAEHSKSTRFAA